jgi:hypothetical protein
VGGMWWKLTGLAIIEAAIITALLWPIPTHAMKIDILRPGAVSTPALHLPPDGVALLATGFALEIAAMLIPMWMVYLVIAKRRAR